MTEEIKNSEIENMTEPKKSNTADFENGEVVKLLLKLKKINKVYQVCNEDQKGRLIEASQKLIGELVAVGFEYSFVEALLVSGKEFVDSLGSNGEVKKIPALDLAPVIFG